MDQVDSGAAVPGRLRPSLRLLSKTSLRRPLLESARVIVEQTGVIGIELSAVEMTYFKAHKQEQAQLALGSDADPLQPMTAAGAGAARDPKMARLAEIVTPAQHPVRRRFLQRRRQGRHL